MALATMVAMMLLALVVAHGISNDVCDGIRNAMVTALAMTVSMFLVATTLPWY